MVKKSKKKKNIFFSISRVLVIFVMGLAVAFVIALSQINLETLRGNVLAVLKDSTGLPVEIDGGVSWKLSLRPQIELNKVRVPNAEWAKHKDAFSAEKIDVTLNLISLFQDRPTIQNVKIYDASVCIEKNDKGEYSISSKNASVSGAEKTEYPFEDPGLGGVEVKNLKLDILGNLYSLAGVNVRYFPRDDTREYSGWIKPDKDVLPFIVSYSKYNAERKIYPVKIALSTGGDALIANIALEGTSKQPIDFIIKGDIPNVAAAGKIFNLNLPDMDTVKVNITGGFDRNKLSFRNSSLTVKDNKLAFSGVIDWSKNVPFIDMDLESKLISLMDLFPDLYSKDWIRPNRELNVFKDIPLYGKDLLGVDLDLHILLDNFFVYRDFDIKDLDLSLNLIKGQGRLDSEAVIGNGNVEIGADINIDEDGRYYVKAAAVGRSMSVGEILNQVRVKDLISDLPVNLDTYLETNGTNLSEWMQNITGPVKIYSADSGYAHSALVANMYGTDFLTTLRHSIQDLFRTEKKYNQMTISCVALNTKLRNGVFDTRHGVAVETNAINVRLAGNMDLGKETMKLSLTTVPVRGLKLSLTGNVVNSIEITGNLAESDVKISGAAVAGKVASATGIGLLLAPFTGGIGLVAGAGVGLLAGDLLENWLADDTPCKTALEKGAPAMRSDPDWLNEPVENLIQSVI